MMTKTASAAATTPAMTVIQVVESPALAPFAVLAGTCESLCVAGLAPALAEELSVSERPLSAPLGLSSVPLGLPSCFSFANS
jgi:hypothetical protein